MFIYKIVLSGYWSFFNLYVFDIIFKIINEMYYYEFKVRVRLFSNFLFYLYLYLGFGGKDYLFLCFLNLCKSWK